MFIRITWIWVSGIFQSYIIKEKKVICITINLNLIQDLVIHAWFRYGWLWTQIQDCIRDPDSGFWSGSLSQIWFCFWICTNNPDSWSRYGSTIHIWIMNPHQPHISGSMTQINNPYLESGSRSGLLNQIWMPNWCRFGYGLLIKILF